MLQTSSGLDALIAGLKDGGCNYVANYPGTHSQDIFFGLGGKRISANEKNAFEMSYGASLAGMRSVVTMKNVGLNMCADQYLHSILTGVQGGHVVVVTDDTRVTGSQEREDSRHFIDFFGGLWLEPSTAQMAYEMAYEAFELSEKLDVPVTIRLTSQFFEISDEYEQREPQRGEKGLASDPQKFIAYPIYWRRQWENLQHKREQIAAYVNDWYDLKESSLQGGERALLVFGLCDDEINAGSYNEFDKLSINHYPLPSNILQKFTQDRSHLAILEQGDPYAYEKVIVECNKNSLPLIVESNTGDCPDLPDQWKVWDHLEKLFTGLEAIQPSFLVGDVGQYTVESKRIVDACLCLGSSVGVTLGLSQAGIEYPFCVVGDGAFLHSNQSALHEAKARSAGFGVIVIDNGGSMATGGQPLIADIHGVDDNASVYEIDYAASTSDDIRTVLLKMRSDNKLSILYVKLKNKG